MLNNENIFSIARANQFTERALEVFRFQYAHNTVYRQWCSLLETNIKNVNCIEKIPFLPIEFFRNHQVVSSPIHAETVIFTSSSTTSQTPSHHVVTNINVYEQSFLRGFRIFYGKPSDYCILALLPNYLQRSGSSLVYMCNRLIRDSGHALSGFFLHNHNELIERITKLKQSGQKTILIGVSYALIDLCETGVELNDNFIVMETGGMKGTRKELLKEELHNLLKLKFNVNSIHSEYGMTEMLSQAYSSGEGLFKCPPWMKVLVREVDDPLQLGHDGKTGGINVIDLANINSCSFIATKDLGRVNINNDTFVFMGRYDHSDIRGCNLMAANYGN